MASVFISHSDREPAWVLERVIRESFPGLVDVFNTSRQSSGLAAGQSIDQGILDSIRQCSVVVWLATPMSVRHSFWMAWELGVATALEKPVVPVRCLGLEPNELPLLQGGKIAPDIGEKEGFISLLQSIKAKCRLQDDSIAKTVNGIFGENEHNNAFWGSEDPYVLTMTMLGERLLVENHSNDNLELMKAVLREGNDPQLVPLVPRNLAHLAALERRIIHLPPTTQLKPGVQIYLEWRVKDKGRFYATIQVQA